MRAILYDPQTGKVRQRVEGHPDAVAKTAAALGATIIRSDDQTAATVKPDGTLVQPSQTLAQAQAAAWLHAKTYRESKMAAGCATPLGRVQTDADSRLAIRDNAAEASANLVKVPAWSVTWTMADNSNVPHSAAQMVAMATAVRTYVNACQAASQVVRAKINAAASAAAVAAVDIAAGYPA